MDFKPHSYNYSSVLSNIPTSSKHRSLPHCCCTRHCHLEAQRRKQAPFQCWRRGTVQTYRRTVQYNMCASHLVCMLTVISIGAHTVFPGLNLLFGRLRAEVGFSCTSEGSPAHSLPRELLPGLNQMASGSNTTRACWALYSIWPCSSDMGEGGYSTWWAAQRNQHTEFLYMDIYQVLFCVFVTVYKSNEDNKQWILQPDISWLLLDTWGT